MALAVLLGLSLVARPLLFASVEPAAARSRGVALGAMSVIFMVALAVTTVAAIQVVGVLLTFSLLVAPAATAAVVTVRPWRGLAVSMTSALVSGVGGVALAVWRNGPVSFWITALASLGYLGARLAASARRRGVFH
jgi:zinc/manganese transport system permease protein